MKQAEKEIEKMRAKGIRVSLARADQAHPTQWHCGACGAHDDDRPQLMDKPDPCLGMLPGVKAACCGHGNVSSAYVWFEDLTDLRGHEALDWFKTQGVGPLS